MPPAKLRRRVVAAVLTLGLLHTLLVSASPASATTVPWSSLTVAQKETQLISAMYVRLNLERSWYHLSPVHASPTLMKSAHAHNLAMARYNLMAHQCPGEASPGTRIWDVGYHWHSWGENVGWTSNETIDGILYMENLMYGEKPPENGHRLNILGNFYSIGIDVYFDSVHHKMWYTQDFASP